MAEGKPSKVELVKIAGAYLKGTLAEEVADPSSTHIAEDNATLLKFHGSYQQDDRDKRQVLRKDGKDKAFEFMVRTRVPGGKLTAAQIPRMTHWRARSATELCESPPDRNSRRTAS